MIRSLEASLGLLEKKIQEKRKEKIWPSPKEASLKNFKNKDCNDKILLSKVYYTEEVLAPFSPSNKDCNDKILLSEVYYTEEVQAPFSPSVNVTNQNLIAYDINLNIKGTAAGKIIMVCIHAIVDHYDHYSH